MYNKQKRSFTSTLTQNKLGVLARRLQEQASPYGTNTDLTTEEQVFSESIKLLAKFYQQIYEPYFDPIDPLADVEPSPEDFNNNFQDVSDDLEVIFSEFENMEDVILGGFNYMVSRLNRLNAKMKSVSSQLADYILLSNNPTKDAIFFADTFNNLSRVEFNSQLLNKDQCEVNDGEGIVTLPVDRSSQQKLTVSNLPVINSNSNGVIGNNNETGASFNGDISVVLDGNPDTWFEYERVVSEDDNTPLVLDLTVNFGQEYIINFVRINPNNFGTRTQIEILAIDTSVDGKQFVSIKDDIPIAGWVVEDEENVFTLAPSTSKYAGQGLYTFTPRKAKYVRLSLRQSTPYVISTSSGNQFRYAIGLRDVHIEALPFKSSGEMISSEFVSTDEIRKVVVLSNQNPDPSTTSSLASIKHYVSPDNGITWHQVRPKVSSGKANTTQEVPELLDFNGAETNSIKTSNAVYSLRYKALLERNPDAFTNDAPELSQETAPTTELHSSPGTTPFVLNLQKSPVRDTVKLVDANFGSRGDSENKYKIGTGIGAQHQITLPWAPLKRVYEKDTSGSPTYLDETSALKLYVNGELWTQGALAAAGATDKVYQLEFETGTVKCGNGTNGAVFPSGAEVSVYLDEERLIPSSSSPHTAALDYPTVNDQKSVTIEVLDALTADLVTLKRGAKVHKLKPWIDENTTIVFSDGTVFASEQTFINGSNEFTAPTAGKYSIDYEKGMLYSADRTSSTADTTVYYFYTPRTKLADSEWSFADVNGGLSNAITISDNKWITIPIEDEDITSSVKYLNFENRGIVRGTVVFSDTTTFAQEVDYIDGRTELLGLTKTTEQIAPISGTGLQTFTLNAPITTSTSYVVSFSNQTLFATEANPPANPNEYYVNRTTRVVSVYTSAAVANPGTVSYYFTNPNATLTGRYSIKYDTGEVFTYTATSASTTVDYQYTDYRVKYPIAREVPSTDYEVDTTNKKVTIKDREIKKFNRLTQLADNNKYYQVSYDYLVEARVDVSELEPFFSPLLRDYSLKIITKNRLL